MDVIQYNTTMINNLTKSEVDMILYWRTSKQFVDENINNIEYFLISIIHFVIGIVNYIEETLFSPLFIVLIPLMTLYIISRLVYKALYYDYKNTYTDVKFLFHRYLKDYVKKVEIENKQHIHLRRSKRSKSKTRL